mmetsp:Transcript_24003/g.42860  ORF Transcript_24003/g.42860 Transcript_24003/m.42860 type:complete len:274 (-) Transcript_24003:127-948(-)
MEARPSAGSQGPRLLGRLTAELILRSPQYMNCIRQYEIDLRGNKISAIENLGATENQFDSIDLSDNAIVKLEGFPKLFRLKQVILNNNRIIRIGKNLEDTVPNLENLVIANNRLSNLKDLDPLAGLSKLTILSLLGNPVVNKAKYRLYVISKIPSLKILDFKKVKLQERLAAKKMFASADALGEFASNTFEPNEDFEKVEEGAAVEDRTTAEAASLPSQDQLIAAAAEAAREAALEEIRAQEEALTGGLSSKALAAQQEDAVANKSTARMDMD